MPPDPRLLIAERGPPERPSAALENEPVYRPTTAVRLRHVGSRHSGSGFGGTGFGGSGPGQAEVPDQVATEEPLEIRACGPGEALVPVAVTMRTPGHDFELAAGFLHTEGILRPGIGIRHIRYCQLGPGETQRYNIVSVALTARLPGITPRATAVSSSCGMCGRASIDDLADRCPPVPLDDNLRVAVATMVALPDRLRETQRVFTETGGLHGAALCTAAGDLLLAREDVGRHNAVDKLIGHELLAGRLPLSDLLLVVSGRVSFEIVQKAATAGIPMIVAVSAPTSLAVDAADRLGITLAGFVRDGAANLYTHPQRVLDAT